MDLRPGVLFFILWFLPAGPVCQAADSLELATYVNWDYDHRESLRGWRNTSVLIESALKQWGLSLSASHIRNQGVAGVQILKDRFQAESNAGVRIFYLASHQAPDGRLEHPDETLQHWTDGWKPDGPLSIFLLDACHAGTIPENRWNQRLPFDFLVTASAGAEKTYELRMFSRRPVDYRRRYPEVVEWMGGVLGEEWDGRVSFLGFLFARQFLETPSAPDSPAAWQIFLNGMENKSKEFSARRGNRFSSTVRLWSAE